MSVILRIIVCKPLLFQYKFRYRSDTDQKIGRYRFFFGDHPANLDHLIRGGVHVELQYEL